MIREIDENNSLQREGDGNQVVGDDNQHSAQTQKYAENISNQKQDNLNQQLNHSGQQQNHSDSSDDDKYYNDNDSKFDLSALKPFDLKAQWLGNTEDVLKKYQQKLNEVEKQKGSLKKGFELFALNQAKYRKNSLRKISFQFDKKKIYQQFVQKSRKPIEKLHPGLLLNIGSYLQRNLFFFLAKMRRVSKVFNFIYKNQEVTQFLSEKDLGYVESRKSMEKICNQWLWFERTFLYYKEMKYTDEIPPNSFKNDLEDAVNFINSIHRRIFKTFNFQIGYFKWLNKFMKVHRVVIALSTLSLTNLIMIRKPSIVAFSNYLALNGSERKKEQITKTKYTQVIKIVQDQDYKDCLIINTKISNFLQEKFGYDFSVFILHSLTGKLEPNVNFLDEMFSYNVLLCHKHNEQKSIFVRQVQLSQGCVLETQNGICVRFNQKNFQICQLSLTTDTDFKTSQLKGSFMNCLIRDHEDNIKFSECIVYNEQYNYLIVIKNMLEYQPISKQFGENFENI